MISVFTLVPRESQRLTGPPKSLTRPEKGVFSFVTTQENLKGVGESSVRGVYSYILSFVYGNIERIIYQEKVYHSSRKHQVNKVI